MAAKSDSPDLLERRGPTARSYWLVKGVCLCGGWPSEQTAQGLIAKHNIKHFLSIQQKSELMMAGIDYFKQLKLVNLDWQKFNPQQDADTDDHTTFTCWEVVDGDAPDSQQLLQVVKVVLCWIRRKEPCYIHCFGGRGRTGVLASCLLHVLDGLAPYKAMDLVQKLYDIREQGHGCSPENHEQRMAVVSFAANWKKYAGGDNGAKPQQQISNAAKDPAGITEQKATDNPHDTP